MYFWNYMTPGEGDSRRGRQLAQASPESVAGK